MSAGAFLGMGRVGTGADPGLLCPLRETTAAVSFMSQEGNKGTLRLI